MMDSPLFHQFRIISGWMTVALGASCAFVIAYAFTVEPSLPFEALLIPQRTRQQVPWKTIRAWQVEQGVTLPQQTNTLVYFPAGMAPISLETVLDDQRRNVRFWGYCFPEEGEEDAHGRAIGWRGKIFLSKRERAVMHARMRQQQLQERNIFDQLDEDTLNQTGRMREHVRHQKQFFYAGEICYVMSEAPLALGTDEDGDGANGKVEREAGTDPLNRDTDGDGIPDGIEIYAETSPTRRDTDGDRIPDGVEDANHNGRTDHGETAAYLSDTDHDGLCDGVCLLNDETLLAGEDTNLNGVVDEDETSPLLVDTDGDGITDEQEFFNCKLKEGGEDC